MKEPNQTILNLKCYIILRLDLKIENMQISIVLLNLLNCVIL